MKNIMTAIMGLSIMFSTLPSYAETIEDIEITNVESIKIDSGNKKLIKEGVGAAVGAGVSYAVSHYYGDYSNVSKAIITTGGAIAGAYVANKIGTDNMVDGVKITYKFENLQKDIEIEGDSKKYHKGKAYLIVDDNKETIHQN